MQVLHVRNLPYEVTHEELAELCEPFGKILQSKLHVGPNKNQAFVEFPDTSQAISMVTYFGNSADPAKVRVRLNMQWVPFTPLHSNLTRGCGLGAWQDRLLAVFDSRTDHKLHLSSGTNLQRAACVPGRPCGKSARYPHHLLYKRQVRHAADALPCNRSPTA